MNDKPTPLDYSPPPTTDRDTVSSLRRGLGALMLLGFVALIVDAVVVEVARGRRANLVFPPPTQPVTPAVGIR